jgi:hypothetical protein
LLSDLFSENRSAPLVNAGDCTAASLEGILFPGIYTGRPIGFKQIKLSTTDVILGNGVVSGTWFSYDAIDSRRSPIKGTVASNGIVFDGVGITYQDNAN